MGEKNCTMICDIWFCHTQCLIFLYSPLPDLRVSRPLIVPGYPENTTAVVGSQAKLVCKVHRPTSTKVQWLKTEVSAQGPIRLRALTVRGHDINQEIK